MKTTELSLNEAVEKCKLEGGVFYHSSKIHAWFVSEDGKIKNVERPETEFTLNERHFLQKWTYEPPEQSYFQKWDSGTGSAKTDDKTDHRKRGWNGAIDLVIKKFNLYGKDFDNIEELKER